MVTLYVPGVVELKVAVEEPEPYWRVCGLKATESPVAGVTVADNVSESWNPCCAVIVIVEVPGLPEVKLTGPLRDNVKSGPFTVNATVAGCDSVSLAAVTVTVVVCADEKVQESVAVPEPCTLEGETLHAELSAERLTTPLNRLVAVTMIVEVPAALVSTMSDVGFAKTVKSTRWNVIVFVMRVVGEPLIEASPDTSTA
jgi:hypothetical protein